MTAYKMVPTVATEAIVVAIALNDDKSLPDAYSAAIAAAPPFVVTDAILDAAIDAEREAFHQFTHEHAGGPVSHADGRRVSIRAAIEAALAEAAKGDV